MIETEKDINEIVDTGREVLCIDNKDVEEHLIKGKRYKVYSHDNTSSIRIRIKSRGGYLPGSEVYSSFSASRFQSIEDMREDKLNQLGII